MRNFCNARKHGVVTRGDGFLETLQDRGDDCTARCMDRQRELAELRAEVTRLQEQIAQQYRINTANDKVHRTLQTLADTIARRLDALDNLTSHDVRDLKELGRLTSERQAVIRANVHISGVNNAPIHIGHNNLAS